MGVDAVSLGRVWRCSGKEFLLGRRTLLMGVVNITPDSFSDGGRFYFSAAAVAHATELERDGADLLDLGAESTRPGSHAVSAEEQLRRLMPVINALIGRVSIPISIDTTSAVVAHACLSAGAAAINDVSCLGDARMAPVCAEFGAGLALMHIKGTPDTMQRSPRYDDLLGEIHGYLRTGVDKACAAGIPADHILVDPGIGFGKTFEHNYRLLGHMDAFSDLAAGVLAGPSRKAFTGEFSQLPADQRQFSTAAAVAIAVLHGADAVRVHDVREMRQVVDILDRFRELEYGDVRGTSDPTFRA